MTGVEGGNFMEIPLKQWLSLLLQQEDEDKRFSHLRINCECDITSSTAKYMGVTLDIKPSGMCILKIRYVRAGGLLWQHTDY